MRALEDYRKVLNLVRLREEESGALLFCIPGAGGATNTFIGLAQCLGRQYTVCAIDTRNFFDADRPFTVEQLAELCCSVIKEAQPNGPYCLCGYSFGALVAYEVAARLAGHGDAVRVTVLIDTGNPGFFRRVSAEERKHSQQAYLSNRIQKYRRLLATGDFRTLSGSIAAVLASRVGPRKRRLIRRAFGAFGLPMPAIIQNNDRLLFEAWLAYVPPPSTLPLLLFYEGHRKAEHGGDRTLGWSLCTTAQVDVELAHGGHVHMMGAQNVQGLAQRLNELVARP